MRTSFGRNKYEESNESGVEPIQVATAQPAAAARVAATPLQRAEEEI